MVHEHKEKVNTMKIYMHYDGSTVTENDLAAPVKERLGAIIDADNALHNIIYDVIDGESLYSQGIDAAFMALEKSKDKPLFCALGKQGVISEAVNYACFFIAMKGMNIARGLQ